MRKEERERKTFFQIDVLVMDPGWNHAPPQICGKCGIARKGESERESKVRQGERGISR